MTGTARRGGPRGWILIPVVIVAIAVIGLVVSSFQKEVGLAAPGEDGRAAVAAALEVDDVLESGESDAVLSSALLVALSAHNAMAPTNTADTRLDHLLTGVLDCYAALWEARRADTDGIWDDQIQGDPHFWETLHPFLDFPDGSGLTVNSVVSRCRVRASDLLDQAIALAG
jgi:hypothetical protein